MIDQFTILLRGGAVLWTRKLSTALDEKPVNSLIQKVILEEKSGQDSYRYDDYKLKWNFENELDLVFVAVYLNMTQMLYIDELMDAIRKDFSKTFRSKINCMAKPCDFASFEANFDKLLDKFESKQYTTKGSAGPRKFEQTAKGRDLHKEAESSKGNKKGKKKEEAPEPSETDQERERRIAANIARLRRGPKKGNKPKKVPGPEPDKPAKRKKQGTKWDNSYTGEDMDQLDFSDKPAAGAAEAVAYDCFGKAPEVGDNSYMEESSSDEDEEEESTGGIFSYFKKLTGTSALTKTDLAPVLATFKDSLMSKNVAEPIAEKLIQSVSTSLEGRKLATFTSVRSQVKQSMDEALTRLLTPKKSVDVLQGIMLARSQKRPYKIVFCGVNGVGKSTSLSKIAAYFISKDLKVSMAACDTFRSGAIEQLRTHATALGVSLYSKGYNKDAASVAMDAVNQATRNGDDVCLIDTAGRMQDNDPLMRALAKLITVNEPDLVLFVGEALVGNDAVDQLTKFNRCLHDLSDNPTNPRLIDGIVLTKFDTIDDKVGAAISMTYVTGQPIMFVGVGQTYKDLRRMNPKLLIKALLK